MAWVDGLVLCAATVLQASLRDKVEAAVAGGFRALTLWPHDYERARAAGASDAELRHLLDDHGIRIEALEPLLTWLPGAQEHAARSVAGAASESDFHRMADALGGARSLILAQAFSNELDVDAGAEALAGVAARAAQHGLVVTLEFLPWSGIPDAATAYEIVRRAAHPGAAVMVDTWHCFRGGCGAAQIRALPGARIGGIQLSDAPAQAPADLITETQKGRLLPGAGDAPLLDLLRALRDTGTQAPLGVEVFSAELDRLPPVEAARRAGDATRKLLAQLGA
jgi:sugar phosphate isomerase/epimerase